MLASAPASDSAAKTHVEVPPVTPRMDVPKEYCVYISATSLLVSTEQLLDAFDHAPGKERRQKTLGDLVRELQALAVSQLP